MKLLLTILFALSAFPASAEEDLLEVTEKTSQEVEKIETDTKTAQKDLDENKTKTDKLKLQLQTLRDLREEKLKKLIEIGKARDAAALEVQELEHQHRQAEADLTQTKEDEKTLGDKRKKETEELEKRKAQLKTEIEAMKQATAAATPRTPASVSSVPTVPAVAAAATAPANASARMEGDMELTKDCRFYASPTKAPQVLGTRTKGSKVHKVAEGSNWIAFPVSETQKGYILKNCFTP